MIEILIKTHPQSPSLEEENGLTQVPLFEIEGFRVGSLNQVSMCGMWFPCQWG